MRVIGFDPGVTGGYAVLEQCGHQPLQVLEVNDIPKVKSHRYKNKVKNRIDSDALMSIVERYTDAVCYCELVYGMKKGQEAQQGSQSIFEFGYHTGMMESVLYATFAAPRINYVAPFVWKKHFNLLKTEKTATVEYCNQMFPTLKLPKTKTGRADALLIGLYGMTMEVRRGN